MTTLDQTDEQHGVVHIAGLDVQIGQMLRQRCSWCAELLVDYDLDRVAVPEGQTGRPATWPVGSLVLIDGGVKATVRHTDGDQLPPTACVGQPAPWTADRYGEPPQQAVDAVLQTWADFNRVEHLARLAAQAVLAGPRGGS